MVSSLLRQAARLGCSAGRASGSAARPAGSRGRTRCATQPHRGDGGRADDRARADHVRRGARVGLAELDVRRGQRSGERVDYVVVSDDNFTPFEPSVDEALAAVPGDRGRRRTRRPRQGIRRARRTSPASTRRRSRRLQLRLDERLGRGARRSRRQRCRSSRRRSPSDHELTVGSTLRAADAQSGKTLDLEVKGIYEAPPFWQMLGAVSIPTKTFDATFNDPRNLYTFVNTRRRRVAQKPSSSSSRRIADFPAVKVDTEDGFSQSAAGLDQPAPQPALRAARAVGDRQPVRHRQHARPLGLRAHARARDAAGGRDDATAGPTDDPPRERHHGADRGRARDGARHRRSRRS